MKTNQLLLVLAIAAFSCSAIAQIDKAAESLLERNRQESVNCRTNVETNWKSSILESKLPFDGHRSPSLEQISNQSKPNAKEKAALLKFTNGLDECEALILDWRRKNFPQDLESIVAQYWSETKYVFSDLYAGKINYGVAARRRSTLATDWDTKINAVLEAERVQIAANEQRKKQEAEAKKRFAEAEFQRQVEVNDRRVAQEQLLERQQAQLNLMQRQAADARRKSEIDSAMNLLQMASPRYQPPRMITCDTDKFGNGLQTTCR